MKITKTIKRGRKTGSKIRSNLIELLYIFGEGYGFDLYKKYIKVYGNVNIRSIYYNLNKGVDLGIFKVKEIKEELGDYSWGRFSEKKIYSLSKNSDINIKLDENIKKILNL